MYCNHCIKNIPTESKFCEYCGSQVDISTKQEETQKPEILNRARCQLCLKVVPVKTVNLNANIGMLFIRYEKHMKGNLCKDCINRTFWNYTLTNLFLGWWGLISFFATFVYMIGNIAQYLGSLSLKKNY